MTWAESGNLEFRQARCLSFDKPGFSAGHVCSGSRLFQVFFSFFLFFSLFIAVATVFLQGRVIVALDGRCSNAVQVNLVRGMDRGLLP